MVINVIAKTTVTTTVLMIVLMSAAFISTAVHAANITVTTSRNPVAVDDSFHLVYEADSSVDGDPDFTPVYEHFDILSSSQSTRMRSINGNWSMKKAWDLAVIAKDIGKFTIPPISFGNDQSPAIQITVTHSTPPNSLAPDSSATTQAQIFLENNIDKKTGWVQSQFIFTIRLLRTVGVTNASLTEPVTSDPDAIVELIAEDQYQTTRKGVRYEVIERRYAIFPQKSGNLKINPLTFEGRVNATQPRTIFDQLRMSGELKRLRSKAISVDVKPAPPGINLQDWLPAGNVQLLEEWSDDIQHIKAGEPVTRTITIIADGLTGVQLPEIEFEEINGLKQYPDKAVAENTEGKTGITGTKQIKVALIPASAGNYTLPEIRLPWWNTKTNKVEIATIPQATINVTGVAQTSAVTSLPAQPKNEGFQDSPVQTGNQARSSAVVIEQNEAYWKWSTLFFAAAWLLTLVLLLKKSVTEKPQSTIPAKPSATSIKSAVAAVVKSAKNNDANATKVTLIEWAQLFYNDKELTNLSQITEHCSAQLSQHIRLLNQSLYSPEKPSWNGAELVNAFKVEQLTAKEQNNKQPSVLKPLYHG